MNPQQELAALEDLMNQLLMGLQEILASGEVLSDEFQGTIAEELNATLQRIQQLQSEMGDVDNMPPTPPTPELEPGPFPSSNVNSFKYDPDSGQLFVKFHGAESVDSGPVYQYGGIPKYIYDVFSRGAVGPKTSGQNQYHRWIKGVTPSLGASLNALIKNGGFPYQRLQ